MHLFSALSRFPSDLRYKWPQVFVTRSEVEKLFALQHTCPKLDIGRDSGRFRNRKICSLPKHPEWQPRVLGEDLHHVAAPRMRESDR